MRDIFTVAAAVAMVVGGAVYAQSTTPQTMPSRSTTAPPAVSAPDNAAKTTAAPVAGKNSFTKSQARKRIEKNGYTRVTGLMKDEQSVWHADAMKAGAKVSVTLDYQGNVTQN